MTPPIDERTLVLQIVQAHLEAEAPALVAELDAAADALFAACEARAEKLQQGGSREDPGLPIDPSFGVGLFVASAFWITFDMVRAAARASDRREMKRELRRLKSAHWDQTERPELVVELHDLVEDVWEQIDRLAAWTGWTSEGAAAASGGVPGDPDLRILVQPRRSDKGWVYWLKARDPKLRLKLKEFHLSRCSHRDPGLYFTDALGDVDRMPLASEEDRAVSEVKLRSLGAELSNELLTDSLRCLLWDLQSSVETLEIVSDEPWTPWELLRVWPRGGSPESGRFLCELYALTRWTYGGRYAARLGLRDLAVVISGTAQLPSVAVERRHLLALAGDGRLVTEIPSSFRKVMTALGSGGHDGWHFAGHALAHGSRPERWGLILDDGKELTPRELHGLRGDLRSRHPLVFLNACSTARAGFGLTGFEGLALQFLKAGAGAVVAAQWVLPDGKAAAFAEAFYSLALSGMPLGACLRESRCRLRKRFAGDPTWLAYTAFAHPRTVVA